MKSLICLKGFDNGRRFLLLSAACYLLFVLMSPLLAQAPVLLILLLLATLPVLYSSSVRRAQDGRLPQWSAWLPSMVFLLCVFAITFIVYSSVWLLLLLGGLVSFGLALLSHPGYKPKADYHWGYSGPMNDPETADSENTSVFERIEPTLASGTLVSGATSEQAEIDQTSHGLAKDQRQSEGNFEPVVLLAEQAHVLSADTLATENSYPNQRHWQKKIQNWFESNRIAASIGLGALGLLIILAALLPASKTEPTRDQAVESTQPDWNKPKQRIAKVEMPDNFWVMLDENDALTIAWQGEAKDDGQIWSAMTGKGTSNCFEIAFNGKLSFRTMAVIAKNNGDYYADFSPVDTASLIDAIAKRSEFKLCGYGFSLKGTQAKLMVNRKYASFLE